MADEVRALLALSGDADAQSLLRTQDPLLRMLSIADVEAIRDAWQDHSRGFTGFVERVAARCPHLRPHVAMDGGATVADGILLYRIGRAYFGVDVMERPRPPWPVEGVI